jgi:hypothetical protein
MNENTATASPTSESIYSSASKAPVIDWSSQHEKILVDWADKATCYKWLHEKTTREFARKNRWFTIPVIIMSTVTGTANFAQDKVPSEYIGAYTMAIGTISLVAGIMTTIQQFLKISELNESHRVSSISWGKFHRNIKVELAKSPAERTPVTQLIKACKEEFDRLIETSQSIPNHVVSLFKETFSGGMIKYGEDGKKLPMTDKQLLFNELTKPEICDSLESVIKTVYKAPLVNLTEPTKPEQVVIDSHSKERAMLDNFILSFQSEKKRLPTIEEIQDNNADAISADLMQAVLSDMEVNNVNNPIYMSSV